MCEENECKDLYCTYNSQISINGTEIFTLQIYCIGKKLTY